MISSDSASIGETVDGRPFPGSKSSLGSGAGKKRKSSPGPDPSSVGLDDYHVEGMPIDKNPDQVRRQIRRFLDNGGMKVGEFCNAIGVSNNAYNRFMQQSGRTKGMGSDVYQEAWAFFAKREMAGLKMPTKKQKTADASAGSGSTGGKKSVGADISGIHLPGEEHDAVPVYETCDEVRKKITTHLGKADVTRAQFCRDLYAQLQSDSKPVKIQSSHLDRFRGNKGPTNGATNSVYYVSCWTLLF